VKTLLLMRHAKTHPAEPGTADHERELTPRGVADARRMAAQLASLELAPAAIISSSAVRAKKTAAVFAERFPQAGDILFYNGLYRANPDQYVEILNELTFVDASPLLLVGHNPEIEEFLKSFCTIDQMVKTASIAQIEFPIDSWKQLGSQTRGELRGFWRPAATGGLA
jgi:phosphohistidine phosphatase